MEKDPDIAALEKARDALWSDPDEEPRPSAETVGAMAVKKMILRNISFREACFLLAAEIK